MSTTSEEVPSPSQDAVADRLRAALQSLDNIQAPVTIDEYLAPWRAGTNPAVSFWTFGPCLWGN